MIHTVNLREICSSEFLTFQWALHGKQYTGKIYNQLRPNRQNNASSFA